jgi:hypothetical protein
MSSWPRSMLASSYGEPIAELRGRTRFFVRRPMFRLLALCRMLITTEKSWQGLKVPSWASWDCSVRFSTCQGDNGPGCSLLLRSSQVSWWEAGHMKSGVRGFHTPSICLHREAEADKSKGGHWSNEAMFGSWCKEVDFLSLKANRDSWESLVSTLLDVKYKEILFEKFK